MKKLFSLILVISLIFSFTASAFASEIVSEDAEVQALYDAVIELQLALENKNLEAMYTAVNSLEEYSINLDESETAEWERVVEEEIGYDEFFDIVFTSAMITYTVDLAEEFKADKNMTTAMYFIESYDALIEEGIVIDEFSAGISEVYEEAATYMPGENVMTVYDNYMLLFDAVCLGDIEALDIAIEEYSSILDDINALSSSELDELALLLGFENGEEVSADVSSLLSDANAVLEVANVYGAFVEANDYDAAVAFIETVDKYDEIYEGDRYLFESFMLDITSVYEMASNIVENAPVSTKKPEETNKPIENNKPAESEKPEESSKPVATDKPATVTKPSSQGKNTSAPKTGDSPNVLTLITLCALAMVVIIAGKKKQA